MRHAYSYIRFSSPDQAKGDSMRRQIEAAETYARAHGLQLDDRLTDTGLSAWSGAHRTRGSLGRFLDAISRGQVEPGSILIVEALDRLSRETPLEALDQLRSVLRAGVDIVTLSDGQHYSKDKLGQLDALLVALVRMSTAYGESQQKSERVREAWQQKKKRAAEHKEALTRGGVAWCRIEDKRYVLVPERAEIVRRIFAECANGVGHYAIAIRLNREGVPHWGRSVGWHFSYIKKILTNRAVLGFYQPHRKVNGKRIIEGDEIADYYPAVISSDLFWSAQAAMSQRRTNGGGRRGKTFSNVFSHVARCACGRPMTHVDKGEKKGTQQRYLVCDALRRGLDCATPRSRWWQYTSTEFAVMASIIDKGITPLDSDSESKLADLHEQLARVRIQLERAESRRNRLLDLDDLNDEAIGSRIREAASEVKRLKGILAGHEASIEKSSSLQSTKDAWEDILRRLAERRKMARDTDEYAFRAKVAQEIRRMIRELRFTSTTVTAITQDGKSHLLFQTVVKPRKRLAGRLRAASLAPRDPPPGSARVKR